MATIQSDKSQQQSGDKSQQQSKAGTQMEQSGSKKNSSQDQGSDDDRKLGAKHVNHPPSAKQGQEDHAPVSKKEHQQGSLKDDEDVDENSNEVK